MHFAFNLLNFRPGAIGGTETYLRELLAHFPLALESAPDDRMTVILDREVAADLPTPGLERCVIERDPSSVIRARVLEAFLPWRDLGMEAHFEQLGLDAILFPQQSIYPKGLKTPAVLSVHDVQHLILPENIPLADRIFRRMIYPWSLRRADRIVSNSGFTSKTLVDFCGVSPEQIDTTLLGFDRSEQAMGPAWNPVDRPFVYYPAVTIPHKNHLVLLESLATLRQQDPDFPHLVLTGQHTPYWRTIERRAEELGIEAHVSHLGFVSREQVFGLYQAAEAVLFPTRFEGFGLPVTEAIAAGSKVLCSDLEVFAELGVPKRMRIDFSKPDAIARGLAEPPPFALEREPVSWLDTATQTLSVMREAADGIHRTNLARPR